MLERVRGAFTVEHRTRTTRITRDPEHPQPTHLLLILVVALVVPGPKRLPEAGRGLGSAIRGFKDSVSTAERREEQPAIQPSREPDPTPGA